MGEINIVSNPGQINRLPIRSILRCLNEAKTSNENIDVINFSENNDFISVSQLAAASMLFNSSKALLTDIKIGTQPNECIHQYVQRMNFYKVIEFESEEHFIRRDPSKKFLPLQLVSADTSVDEIANSFNEILKTQFKDDSAPDMMNYAFGEIMDNIIQHAQSLCPGVAGAQLYPKLKYVEFCIADTGIGIPASLKSNSIYAYLSNQSLLEKAFEEKVTAFDTYNPDNKVKFGGGFGLTSAARLTQALKGHLWAVSYGSGVHITEDGITKLDNNFYFPGTIIVMQLPIDKHMKVLESEMFSGGRDYPVRWNSIDGSGIEFDFGEPDDILW